MALSLDRPSLVQLDRVTELRKALASLEGAQLAWALDGIDLNPSTIRTRRLEARDEAVRQGRRFWPTPKALATALGQYLATAWLRERDLRALPDTTSMERQLLHRIARLNDGRPLSRSQVWNIQTIGRAG